MFLNEDGDFIDFNLKLAILLKICLSQFNESSHDFFVVYTFWIDFTIVDYESEVFIQIVYFFF